HTAVSALPLHDALPIFGDTDDEFGRSVSATRFTARPAPDSRPCLRTTPPESPSERASFQRQDFQDAPSADQATIRHRTGKAQAGDRKSTRLNSSHVKSS